MPSGLPNSSWLKTLWPKRSPSQESASKWVSSGSPQAVGRVRKGTLGLEVGHSPPSWPITKPSLKKAPHLPRCFACSSLDGLPQITVLELKKRTICGMLGTVTKALYGGDSRRPAVKVTGAAPKTTKPNFATSPGGGTRLYTGARTSAGWPLGTAPFTVASPTTELSEQLGSFSAEATSISVAKSTAAQRGVAVGAATSPGGSSICSSLAWPAGIWPSPSASSVFTARSVVKAKGCEPACIAVVPPASVKVTSTPQRPNSGGLGSHSPGSAAAAGEALTSARAAISATSTAIMLACFLIAAPPLRCGLSPGSAWPHGCCALPAWRGCLLSCPGAGPCGRYPRALRRPSAALPAGPAQDGAPPASWKAELAGVGWLRALEEPWQASPSQGGCGSGWGKPPPTLASYMSYWPGSSGVMRLDAVLKKTSPPEGLASANSESSGLLPEEIRLTQPPALSLKAALASVQLPFPTASHW